MNLLPEGLRGERNGGKTVNHRVEGNEFVSGRVERRAVDVDAGVSRLTKDAKCRREVSGALR